MTNDENWDREAELNQIFNPDDVSQWLKYSPLEFIGITLLEIKQQNVSIRNWSEIMAKIPEFNAQVYQLNNQEITAKFFLEVNLASSRIIDRLLATMHAYAVEMSKSDNE
ncbi:MAG: hypothetical protein GC179_08235 [Anaerolineaceae bacterium]|nr:hypothetical protein [Anaerolineaceae bacterium]